MAPRVLKISRVLVRLSFYKTILRPMNSICQLPFIIDNSKKPSVVWCHVEVQSLYQPQLRAALSLCHVTWILEFQSTRDFNEVFCRNRLNRCLSKSEQTCNIQDKFPVGVDALTFGTLRNISFLLFYSFIFLCFLFYSLSFFIPFYSILFY